MRLFNTPGGWMRLNTDRVLSFTAMLVGVGSLVIIRSWRVSSDTVVPQPL